MAAKLTPQQKSDIGAASVSKKPLELAEEYGVSVSTIRRAIAANKPAATEKAGTAIATQKKQVNAKKAQVKKMVHVAKAIRERKELGPFDAGDIVFNTELAQLVTLEKTNMQGSTFLLEGKVSACKNDILALQTIVNEQSIVVVHQGVAKTMAKGHRNFNKVKTLISDAQWREVVLLIDEKQALEHYSHGRCEVRKGKLFLDGELLNNALARRIVIMTTREGAAVDQLDSIMTFLEALMENPSYRAVNELYGFLEHNDIEITDDGHFYAWKAVRRDYTDKHTGTIDNSVGTSPRVARNKVDENSEVTCSHGLHVCAKSYLGSYSHGGDRILKVKVHPRDVVAIPKDYHNSKMRCCGYEVVEDVTGKIK